MNTYIAYVPLNDEKGNKVAIAAAAATVGAAIRDVSSKVNAAVASSGGYTKNDKGETLLVTLVFEIPEGTEQARHEFDGDEFRAFGVPGEGENFPLRPVFVGAVDPIKAVDGRINL